MIDAAHTDALDSTANPDVWEAWSRVAVILAAMMAVLWILAFARIGITSVKIHAMAIPTFGALTLPVLAWGLFRTLFRPPVMRRSRTIAFVVLLATGAAGNVPIVAAPVSTEDFVSTFTYRLPVRGEWIVLAGGDELARNYHATTASIRWGTDFTRVENGSKFRLDGKATADWYCFGEPVYAPVGGKIMRATNKLVDNRPGEISPDSTLGNYVVIEAGPAEYAFIAHMQKDSVTVKAGDTIEAGAQIGKCGNSGRSPEPHVHMHVQDRLEFPVAMGLPVPFSDYIANGKPVSKGMPFGGSTWDVLDGQTVSAR